MSLSLFLFTYNCGKTTPIEAEFGEDVAGLIGTDMDNLPDLLAFGFQEISSVSDGTDSSVVNVKLLALSNLLLDSLAAKIQIPFEVVDINHLGNIGLVLVSPYKSRFKRIRRSANVPLGYFITNVKGAVGLRVTYEPDYGKTAELTFVVAHLAANEGVKYLMRRNNDLDNIFHGLSFQDGYGVYKPNTHCFIMGDLNYRKTGAYHFSSDQNHERTGIQLDELNIMRTTGKVLWGFKEAPIRFLPTYKFKTGTGSYNYKRTPSWCDRILYLDYKDLQEEMMEMDESKEQVIEYNSVPSIKLSDHIPVFLKIKVPVEAPMSVINSKGYLMDKFTHLSNNDVDLKPQKRWYYYREIANFNDRLMGLVFYLVLTTKGRIILIAWMMIAYLLVHGYLFTI
ncbi:hypothetical protein OGAPHI_004180 [Ogataea philodendri]|uniref:Inositol polyphosphate-related phosphatase domain-containing protein n=1 Tax=Ogataea philodendri TaxID=1378263 RepID=A0A9P8T5J0_9ASCO|nr:uncharacterized protein OGAPHI_004180 [Ogataea philodendri]KAH3665991.1 hypothetical protein OGAPHI_004180 [Ogataea philodendri]